MNKSYVAAFLVCAGLLFSCNESTTSGGISNEAFFSHSMNVKDYNSAVIAAQMILMKDSSQTSYEDTLPELYVAIHNFESAEIYADKVIQRKKNDERMYQIKALCYQQMGRVEDEFNAYKKLYEITHNLSYLYQVTAFQLSTNNEAEATKNLDQLEKLATPSDSVDFAISETEKQKVPVKAACYNMRAYIQAQKRDMMGAKTYFEKALSVYPDFIVARRNYEQLVKGKR